MGGRAANRTTITRTTDNQHKRWRGWDYPSYHCGSDRTVVTVKVEARTFPCGFRVSLRCGALGIRAEHPNLPRDRAVVRVERQVRDVFLLGARQGGGRRSREIQVEKDLLLHRVVFLLYMEVVRRGEVWREIERLCVRGL